MKNLLIAAVGTAAIALSASAIAATPGYFVGGQVGYSKVHQSHAKDNHGVGYGVYAGYNFDQNYGVQLGVNKVTNVKINTSAGNNSTTRIYDIDLLANAYLPLNDQFELFAKGGVAFVKAKASNVPQGYGSSSKHYYRPKVVLGGSYDYSKNVSFDVSYSRIFKQGSANGNGKYLPNIDLAAVGVNYNF